MLDEKKGAIPSEPMENGVSHRLIHPAPAGAELSKTKLNSEKFPRVKAIRTFVLDERMLKEQMRFYGHNTLEDFLKEIKNSKSLQNVMLERTAVYQDNITLDFEVTENE